jgi:hypothetical protein
LFIVESFFVQDKVCEVLNDILMYIFHEGFDDGFWGFLDEHIYL